MRFFKNFLFFLLLILIIAVVDYLYIGNASVGIDDGNIFLNYAHHIANGEGFVFNTGGEKVEGFTSFLWVLVCAWFYAFSPHPEHLLIVFSLLLTSLTVTLVFIQLKGDAQKINKQFADKYLFWIYSAFILSTGPSYITWSVLSLMENTLWNFVFTALILLILQTYQSEKTSIIKKILIVLLGCILTITRPESLAWNICFTALLAWISRQKKQTYYFPVLFLLAFAATSFALLQFRLHYFGYALPNTYYAKISPDKVYNFTEGFIYAVNFLAGYQPVITLCFVLMMVVACYNVLPISLFKKNIIISNNERVIYNKTYAITFLLLIGLALPCTTGGDHFGGFRFYQELMLFFSWAIIPILWMEKNRAIIKKQVIYILLATSFIVLSVLSLNDVIDLKDPSKTQLNFEFQLAVEGRKLADTLNTFWPDKTPSVGMIAVGGFSLKYKGATVDLMGLNNTLMGHSPGDRKGIKNHAAFNKEVFYKLNPDIILPSIIKDFKTAVINYADILNENNFYNQAMKNIFNDKDFQSKYFPVVITYKYANVFAFVKNDFLNAMEKGNNLKVQRIYL